MKLVRRFLLFALILPAALTACMDAPNCARADIFCAGLVTDTLGVDDSGINEDLWIALQSAREQKLADYVSYVESLDARDYEKNLSYLADKGYDVIFSSGITLDDATLRAAEENPNSIFVSANQEHESPPANLIQIQFPEDQAGFLAGALAARVTRTGFIGAVCEKSDLPAIWRYCEGFRAGARYANPTVRVLILYNDNVDKEKIFVDMEWGESSARNLIGRGADVLFAAGGLTAQAALRVGLEKKIKVIGAERNQAAAMQSYDLSLLASFYGDANFAAETLLRQLRQSPPEALPAQKIKMAAPSPVTSESILLEAQSIAAKLWVRALQTGVTHQKQ